MSTTRALVQTVAWLLIAAGAFIMLSAAASGYTSPWPDEKRQATIICIAGGSLSILSAATAYAIDRRLSRPR